MLVYFTYHKFAHGTTWIFSTSSMFHTFTKLIYWLQCL